MPRIKFQRESEELRAYLASMIGEGIHTSFRKFSTRPISAGIHKDIMDLPDKHWHQVCVSCARSAISFGLRNPNARNSNNSRSRLSFLLARRVLHTLRKLAQNDAKGCEDLLNKLELLGIREFRKTLDVLADVLMRKMTEPQAACADCRWHRSTQRPCERCNQTRCPVHCNCSARSKRKTRST